MIKEIFVATNNQAKIERFKNLLETAPSHIIIRTPKDFGLDTVEVEESGASLAQNAEIKARAYYTKVAMPILANDTGLWVMGEGMVNTPKRTALGGLDEKNLTDAEIAEKLLEFWKNIATKNGGSVDAAWVEAFALLDESGNLRVKESRREILLTDTVFGDPHIQTPVRCLYISKTTNKPSIQHTPEEELLELQPVTDALCALLEHPHASL